MSYFLLTHQSNDNDRGHAKSIHLPINVLAGQDLATLEKKIPETVDKKPSPAENPKTETEVKVEGDPKKETEPKASTDTKVEAESKKEIEPKSEETEQKVTPESKQENGSKEEIDKKVEAKAKKEAGTKEEKIVDEKSAPASQPTDRATLEAPVPKVRGSDKDKDTSDEDKDKEDEKTTGEATAETTTEDPFDTKDDDDSIYLGLRVYTDKSAPAVLAGQLRNPEKDLSSLVNLNL
ncbi:hypothetical protein BDZ94DRAFT_856726 [Collybia nuda]|uniref:Uncharacterized protein n=1 Tax=Collybia nuda TaxID=64659 RepID=A0A9P6CCU7_9AGAR|nr:hypothetical protein BDZ94DRAFT_856726 [Collybia nuda]